MVQWLKILIKMHMYNRKIITQLTGIGITNENYDVLIRYVKNLEQVDS